MNYSIGIDCGGTKVAYGLFDDRHNLLERFEHQTKTDGTAEEILQDICNHIVFFLKSKNILIGDLFGIGIAFPSYVDYETGYINKTVNIKPLKNIYARDYIEKQLATKVVVDNDCHVAALAEHRFGAGKGFEHMLYCCVSTGISSGIVINNQIFRGSYGTAGESGHMLITPDEGFKCGCENKGCFMSMTSGSMIGLHVQKWLQEENYTNSLLLELAQGNAQAIDAIMIHQAALQNDPLALRAVQQMAKYMGIWLFNLYQILNINCYVFGGGLVHFGDLLFEPIKKTFYQYLKNQGDHPIYFKFAELDNNFGIIGAEQLLFQ